MTDSDKQHEGMKATTTINVKYKTTSVNQENKESLIIIKEKSHPNSHSGRSSFH